MQLVNAAATRQRTDLLWDSQDLLGAGGTFSGAVRLVAGYGGINFFISSNLSFRLRIQEGPTSSGPWTETDRIASALNDAADAQIICQRIVPCGSYMRIFVDNLGGLTQTSFVVHGLGIAAGDTSTAVVTAGGVFDEDTDDDSIASGQTTLLSIVENYQFDGSVWRRLQSRGAVADQAYTIQRTLVDSVLRGDDGGDYAAVAARIGLGSSNQANSLVRLLVSAEAGGQDVTGGEVRTIHADIASSISGRSDAAIRGLYSNSIVVGLDNTGAGVLRPVEARNFDGAGDVAASLIGLLVNGRMASFGATDWASTRIRVGSGALDEGVEQFFLTQTIVRGIDSSAGVGARAVNVEARNFDANSDVTNPLVGLLVNARNSFFDQTQNDWSIAGGTSSDSVGGTLREAAQGAYVYEARESAFAASRRGRRFYATHQTPTTSITAQATFVATTPTLLLQLNAASVRVIVRSLRLVITNATIAPVDIAVAIDTTNRVSVNGTLHTPQNTNEESATGSGVNGFHTNPTATAAGAGTRYLVNDRLASGNGSSITIDFKDGVLLSSTASFLVYLFDSAGASAPTYYWTMEWEEVA